MEINDEQVKKYMILYLQKYGKDINKARARDELTSLVCLLDAVYKQLNKNNFINQQ
jgi:hypothetical protein